MGTATSKPYTPVRGMPPGEDVVSEVELLGRYRRSCEGFIDKVVLPAELVADEVLLKACLDPDVAKTHEDGEHVENNLLTLCYSFGFIGIGLMVGLIGPALPDLARHLDVEMSTLGVIFLARGTGGLTGSMMSGQFLDRLPGRGHIVLFLSALIMALGAGLIPVCTSTIQLLGAVFLMDTGLGGVGCSGNTLCTWEYHRNPAPHLNLLNGAFGAGALLAPLIVEMVRPWSADASHCFWLMAAMTCCLSSAVLIFPSPVQPPSPEQPADAGMPFKSDSSQGATGHATRYKYLLPFTTLFVLFIVGAEIDFGVFLVTYIDRKSKSGALQVSQREANFMNSGFWLSFTWGRLALSALSRFASPAAILAIEFVLMVTALGTVLIIQTPVGLWIGSIMYGMGLSGCYAAAITQMQQKIGLSGTAGGWISAGASAATIFQLLTAQVADNADNIMHSIATVAAMSISTMVIIWLLYGWKGSNNHVRRG
ncbi:hypothetical protein CYMTET_4552 [Cymbomonas tetramitiformis]|uniref:Uncharacterized protein n=1 Tax=Cymbomonas tetramitiformis TaxID=36881 RepID=A0AAE0LKD2_9CHLO|nr:hypothetical protein CYMTET_4552 [Cymbomonas tetramitiformis]